MDVVYKPSLINLNLQILVHYNVLFTFLYACVIGAVTVEKAMNYETYLPLVVFIFWVFMEPIRLYFGFKGNLREMVPDLSTFLLMVVFPQIPLIVYMSFLQPLLFTADIVVGSLMLIFLALELLYGTLATRQLIAAQTAQFMRLCEAED